MDVTMMLCDWAENVNGKLYMQGAGWNLLVANSPASVALGIVVTVPWNLANVQHELVMELIDEDGHRVALGEPPQQIAHSGTFETGRPPGVPAGTGLPFPMAWRWSVLPLPPGGYSFVVSIDGDIEARASFRAIQPQ